MSYYAVRKGNVVGVFDTWPECQKSIQGFSKPEHMKFNTREEAEAYVAGIDLNLNVVKKDLAEGFLVAFTDGSYDKDTKQYAHGVVIIDKDCKEIYLSGSSKNEHYSDSTNIAGEVFAVINAMDWAVSNGYEKIKIYHDYIGISEWISGRWKANTSSAKLLVSLFGGKYADILNVTFEHIKGHSNNRFNDKADELAANAISNRQRIPVTGDNWFKVQHVDNKELEIVLDIVKTEESSVKINKEIKSDRILYRMKLDQDKLTVTSFTGGPNALLVQGKMSLLFQVVTTYIQDLLDNGNITAMFSSAYRTIIDKEVVDTQVQTFFTEYPTDYPENLKKLIKQSAINLIYRIDSEDYGQYIYPSLRALEGQLKYLLGKGGITITIQSGFYCFNNSSACWKLTAANTLDKNQIKNVERMYGYYHNYRHSLFHFGDIIGGIDTTRTISSRTDADLIIKECLKMIKESL